MQYNLADPSTISASVFDDEIVVANFATGTYYSLRFAAAEIWLGLMAGVPAEQVIQAIAPHCTTPQPAVAEEAWSLIESLKAERLIKTVDRSADDSWAPRPMFQPYPSPLLETFKDMEDLLLLDPIHDVGKTGWPDPVGKT